MRLSESATKTRSMCPIFRNKEIKILPVILKVQLKVLMVCLGHRAKVRLKVLVKSIIKLKVITNP